MDFKPNTEQQMIIDLMREFVENELIPHEEEVERTDNVTPELAEQIRNKAIETGIYAANMPEK